jgi:hypothetical protein
MTKDASKLEKENDAKCSPSGSEFSQFSPEGSTDHIAPPIPDNQDTKIDIPEDKNDNSFKDGTSTEAGRGSGTKPWTAAEKQILFDFVMGGMTKRGQYK